MLDCTKYLQSRRRLLTNPSAVRSFNVFVLPTLTVSKFSFRNTFSCNNPTSLPGKEKNKKRREEEASIVSTHKLVFFLSFFPFSFVPVLLFSSFSLVFLLVSCFPFLLFSPFSFFPPPQLTGFRPSIQRGGCFPTGLDQTRFTIIQHQHGIGQCFLGRRQLVVRCFQFFLRDA